MANTCNGFFALFAAPLLHDAQTQHGLHAQRRPTRVVTALRISAARHQQTLGTGTAEETTPATQGWS